MLAAGLSVRVVPVFHIGEPWEVLGAYLEDHDYIALGGMVPFTRRPQLLRRWLNHAFALRGDCQFHGFGLTSLPLMRDFPWHSVDSSSWTSGFRFGSLGIFDERRGAMTSLSLTDPGALLRHAALLKGFGVDAHRIALNREAYDMVEVARLALRSWLRLERWLQEQRCAST